MKQLWAPWRMKYIGSFSKERACIFCAAAKTKSDAGRYVLQRRDKCFSLLNIFPYNNGHIMVAPYKHAANLHDLDKETLADLLALVSESQLALHKAFNPEGYNIGINVGRAGGAGIVDHIHIHIVPRWNGDTNFMPVIGDTKIVSQSLEDTYAALIKSIRKKKR
jgi:ATP adenylyltransferase